MVDSNDVIGKTIGDFGKWQLRAVLLIFLCKIPASWFMACIIFTAPPPKYGEFFCKPPVPIQSMHFSHLEKEDTLDFCYVYKDVSDYIEHSFNHSYYELWKASTNYSTQKVPCQNFQHLTDYRSIITDYDLVCSREILVAVTQFFHLFGILVGGCVAFKMLEFSNPKQVMAIGMVSQIVFGVFTGLAPNYEIHVAFRCMAAGSCAVMFTAGGVICLFAFLLYQLVLYFLIFSVSDITNGKYKTVVITLYDTFWSVGVILLPGLAINFTDWTLIYMAITFPTLLLIISLKWTPDSPRWWIKRGNVERTKSILIEASKVNGTNLPQDIDQLLKQKAADALSEPNPAGWIQIWQVPFRVKISIVACHLVWALYIVNFMGMLVNVRTSEPELVILNTIVCGFCEIFGLLIGLFLILKIQPKWQISGALNVICGIVGLTAQLVPDTVQGPTRTILFMVIQWTPKITISTTLALLATCSTEMIEPRKKKMTAFSSVVFARIWLLTAPFVCVTNNYGKYVAQTAFAGLCIIGGLFTMLISSSATSKKMSIAE